MNEGAMAGWRTCRRWLWFWAASGALLVLAGTAHASFGDVAQVADNQLASGTLKPPTAVDAVDDCLLLQLQVTLSWTATASPRADGYRVLRSTTPGGPYTEVGEVLGLNATEFIDTVVALATTYHYVVRTDLQAWTSADSNEATITTASLC